MTFHVDKSRLEAEWGIVPMASDWMPKAFKNNFAMACDAQPALVTQPNAGIPAWLTSFVDPEVVRILQTPNKGAQILGEVKKGDWETQTAYFPMIENVGEVSSYGDYNDNGISDVNASWEARQPYLFQTHLTIGDLEEARAGAAKLNLVAEKQISAAKTLDKFQDITYHFGVAGLANYGVLNDPSLPAPVTPSTKAAGGVKWVNNGQVNAQAGEVYSDFMALYTQLATQAPGQVDTDTEFTFVYASSVSGALAATNQFGITVKAYIKETFPNVNFVSDPRYSTSAGNVVQLIAKTFDGQQTGYCAFNEKLRDHRIEYKSSSYLQKKTSGSFGAIIRYPLAFATMLGV
jgi:hypothetical protein